MSRRFQLTVFAILCVVSFGHLAALRAQDEDVRIGGVLVNPEGELKVQFFDARVNNQRAAAALKNLPPDLAKTSAMRKVSLPRLEQALAERIADGKKASDEMLALAGLTRIEYVFLYPESGDVVVAGPAEPWAEDASGRVRGVKSGRPVVELQDLVVALRMYAPGSKAPDNIGCSIDATPEGLSALQRYLAGVARSFNQNSNTDEILAGMKQALGMQEVTVLGVSPSTHMAQILVEADYRMKLLGIGLERMPGRMKNWVDRASAGSLSNNAMQRWYFVPNYECVRVSDDSMGMQLVGDGVKLVNEDEVVMADGSRAASGTSDPAGKGFTQDFTKNYAKIAAASPVYGQLRNVIDMAVAAAFMRQHNYFGKANWTMTTFASEEQFAVETYHAPMKVAPAVNGIWKGKQFKMPIGGGVHIEATEALDSKNRLADESGEVSTKRSEIKLDQLAEGQWWWD